VRVKTISGILILGTVGSPIEVFQHPFNTGRPLTYGENLTAAQNTWFDACPGRAAIHIRDSAIADNRVSDYILGTTILPVGCDRAFALHIIFTRSIGLSSYA
jgi:hypothetical protein